MSSAPDFATFRNVCTLSQIQEYSVTASPVNTTQYVNPVTIRARIVPNKTVLAISGTQLNPDVTDSTHFAETWTIPNVDIFDVLQRTIKLADGTGLLETYNVLGTMFLDEECRFMRLDLRLLTTVSVPNNGS